MLKNALIYMSGSVLAQVVMLAAVPLLSRLYTPDDFGVFGLFTAILSIIGVAACLRYELAIPLPQTNRQAAQVFAAGLAALLTVSMLVLLAVVAARSVIAEALGAPKLEALLWLLPLSVLGYGLYSLLTFWLTRNGRFKALAASHVTRACGVTGTQLTAATASGGGFGLVFGQLAGQWAANLVLAWQILRNDRGLIMSSFKLERIAKQAHRYRTFALHGAPQALLNSASQAVPAVMLGWLFNPVVVGLYIMAQRVVSAPLTLVSQSLRQAMLPHFSQQHQKGAPLSPLLWRYTGLLGLIGFPVLLLLMVYGQVLFSMVLGGNWREAGQYAGWLAPWLWTNMFNPASFIILTILEKQKIQFIAEGGLLLARLAALSIGGLLESTKVGIVLFSLSGVIFNVVMLVVAYAACKQVEE